jgi:D-3-phosphoglycerate dehydrogenase
VRAAAAGRRAGASRFRVLVTDAVAPEGLELLRRDGRFEVDVRLKLAGAELRRALAKADALMIRSETQVTRDVLGDGGRLKIIGRAGVGVDNVDVEAATRLGVLVVNAPEGNTIAAAEHTFALLLALARRVPAANASLRNGEWKRSRYIGRELYRKTLGVIGLGRIGAEVARRARSFGMTVIGADPVMTAERAAEIGAELVDMKTLLKRADIVSLHTPLTPETRHLLGAPQFAQMKKGAWVVNCARGGLVDEAALAEAIQRGRIGGAALDVFEREPPPAGHALLHLDAVVATPHLGASTEEAQVNVSLNIAEQIRDYLGSGLVRSAVNAPTTAPELRGVLEPYANLAERMGRFLIQLATGQPRRLELEVRGELAKQPVAPLTAAAVKGALSPALRERVNAVNALAIARERGLVVSESTSSEAGDFSALVRLIIETDRERRSMDGTVIGKNEPHVVAIDGLHLDIVPEGVMIVYTNVDRPGIVGKVGTILGRARINIAGLHLGRLAVGKRAVSIFSVDNPVPPSVLAELSRLAELDDVRVVTV